MLADMNNRSTENLLGNISNQVRNQFGHVVVIGISLISFQRGKFRVMAFVNAFVAEVSADFKHAVKSADDQALQIKFRSNAQI